MDFHPDVPLPLAHLQRAWAPWDSQVPMTAADAAGQLAFAPNDEAASSALIEDLIG